MPDPVLLADEPFADPDPALPAPISPVPMLPDPAPPVPMLPVPVLPEPALPPAMPPVPDPVPPPAIPSVDCADAALAKPNNAIDTASVLKLLMVISPNLLRSTPANDLMARKNVTAHLVGE